jgi:hypothetical protein
MKESKGKTTRNKGNTAVEKNKTETVHGNKQKMKIQSERKQQGNKKLNILQKGIREKGREQERKKERKRESEEKQIQMKVTFYANALPTFCFFC